MKKEEFKQKTMDLLSDLGDCISELEAKLGDVAEDAKGEYDERLKKLKELKNDLTAKLDEYEKIADSKWDVIKDSAGNFFNTVAQSWKENFAKISEALKK